MKSIVILGADGYIGSRLTRKLSQTYMVKVLIHNNIRKRLFQDLKTVKVFSGNILNHQDLEKIIQTDDIVVCLAGTTTVSRKEKNHFEVNSIGQQVVAEFCAKKNARVIYFSTANVYTNGENSSKESDQVQPQDAYSFSKKLGEEIYEFYSRVYDLPVVVFRLGSVYGPGQHKGIVFTMIQSLEKTNIIEIPKQIVVRDLIYIDDVLLAVEKAILYQKKGFHIFNITSGKAKNLFFLAQAVCKISKRGRIIKVDRKSHPAIVSPSISKAEKQLAFQPKTSLESGLRKTILSKE